MQSILDLFFRAQKQNVDPFNHNRVTYGPSYAFKEGKGGPFYCKKGLIWWRLYAQLVYNVDFLWFIKAKCDPYYVQKRGSGKCGPFSSKKG